MTKKEKIPIEERLDRIENALGSLAVIAGNAKGHPTSIKKGME